MNGWNIKTFLLLPVISWRQTETTYEFIEDRGGGGTPLPGLKGYVPQNKLVFKDSSESQKSTISLFSSYFILFYFILLYFIIIIIIITIIIFYLGVFLDRKQFKECEGWL